MSINRITGIASGLDTEQLISDLMEVERAPLDRLQQKQQLVEWQRDAYREINTKILSLRTEVVNMKLTSSYKVFSATASDTTVLSATSTANAVEGTYNITVDQLATATQRMSTGIVSSNLQSSDNITDFNVSGKEFKLTYNGVQKTISWGDSEGTYASIGELVSGLQTKIDNVFGSNQIQVSNSGDQLIITPKDSTFKPNIIVNSGETNDALAQLQLVDGQQYHIDLDTRLEDLVLSLGNLTFSATDTLDFTINGEEFSIEKTKTLRELMSTVNANENADVSMSYDTTLDKFIIKRDTTGAGVTLNISDDNGTDFLSKINVTDVTALTSGQNAIIDFTDPNNITMTDLEMTSNNFTLQGINITLLNEDTTEQTITITKDVDTVYNNIVNFIEKYNEVITTIGTKYNEERDRDYQPLTDTQKEEMSEEQIELWEEKAKSGLLKGDSILNGIMTSMRKAISDTVTDLNTNFNQLTDIGITTGSYSENGKLYINEAKLKEAISENIDDVMNFFSFTPPNLQSSTLSGTIDVEGKDFKITVNGIQQTINLSGSYDISNSDDRSNLVSEIQTKIDEAFGTGRITVAMTNNKITFASSKGYSIILNSGDTNDALDTLGFNDNDTYDATKKGVVAKLYDKLIIGGGQLSTKAGSSLNYYDTSTLGQELIRISDEIDDYEDKLVDIEERYYSQFTAMEAALDRMNTQSAWLSQQLGLSQ